MEEAAKLKEELEKQTFLEFEGMEREEVVKLEEELKELNLRDRSERIHRDMSNTPRVLSLNKTAAYYGIGPSTLDDIPPRMIYEHLKSFTTDRTNGIYRESPVFAKYSMVPASHIRDLYTLINETESVSGSEKS